MDCQYIGNGELQRPELDKSCLRKKDIESKNILFVEWIRKTGRTFAAAKEKILALNPAAL
jgi:hypothetical protein